LSLIDVGSANWDSAVLKSPVSVIVDFWAPWCPWCKRLEPEFGSLSNEYAGRLVFAKVDVEQYPEIAEKYGVQGLPTLKMICSGRPVGEIVGYLPKDTLRNQLDLMLSTYDQCLKQSSSLHASEEPK